MDYACGCATEIWVKYGGSGGDGADFVGAIGVSGICSWAEFVGLSECVNIDDDIDRRRPCP